MSNTEHSAPRTAKGLSAAQWTALALLTDHEKRLGRPLEAGDAGTYTATWADNHTTGIHLRTAQALARRGLVTIDATYAAYDEPADLYLTDKGREVVANAHR